MRRAQPTGKLLSSVLVAGFVFAFATGAMAQETSKTETTRGPTSTKVEVARAEVIYASGNELVVRMESGEVRHLTVPSSARATVDGKELSVHDLKPGMKLERTIVTTTTPRMVTTVRIVQGKVFHVMAPISVILTLPDGTNKQYKVPEDQKFTINGEEKTVFDLRKGMNVTATVVTQVPETVVAQQTKVTGSAPPPLETPQIQGALLIEDAPAPAANETAATPAPEQPAATAPAPEQAAAPAPAPAAEPAPEQPPKSGRTVLWVGLVVVLCVAVLLAVRKFRHS